MRDARGDRRGRRPNRPDPAAGPVEAFADRLWQLKIAAGDPSFAEMCAQGAAASKSSLAAAAQGRVLPSWGVTWEFVRVLAVGRLGQDPAAAEREWRSDWTRTKALTEVLPEGIALSSAAPTPSSTESGVSPGITPPPAEGLIVTFPGPVSSGSRAAARFRPKVLAAVVAVFAVVSAGVVLFDGGSPETSMLTPVPLDESVFEADVTIPDGTLVGKGEAFEKVWRIRNAGKVAWAGRFLMRVNDTLCAAPRRVEIPHTPPGSSVDVRVTVEAPATSGACKIFWKMVDAEGRLLFPDKRPIFLDVRVS
ncbi:NBR1-Ig-like domain-containing protein [Herbidospora daliensis]|uniref:NBR1-Ig-like domain-containing protein n=1 Tax=Herbidospora daliensis TaxID=295585 RepID=UPI00078335AE|nr:NBR1-Ig-like domain-containing protein [Herbidospora daliensis]